MHIASQLKSVDQHNVPGKHSDTKNPEPSASNKEVNQLSEEPANTEYSLFPMLGSNSKLLQTTMLVEGHMQAYNGNRYVTTSAV